MNTLPVYLCAAFLLAASSPLTAQQTTPPQPAVASALPDPTSLVPDSDSSYLAPLLVLRPLRASYAASPQWRDLYFEMSSFYESFIGNDAEAIADFDAARPPAPQPPLSGARASLSGYTAVDARQSILNLARNRQAVFINEAHHVPMDRAFTLSLLRGLYAQGFRYFAAETLDEKDTDLQKRGYPALTTGYYAQEPIFGDLVRTALRLGYQVVPYEYHGPQSPDLSAAQNQRERGEAQNLYTRIFKVNPRAKVLVEAGYGHIAKTTTIMHLTPGSFSPTSRSIKNTPMALWFERISKIVPLSVDQSTMMERSSSHYESPFYQVVSQDNLLQQTPTALKNKRGDYFVDPSDHKAYDLFVFHPRTLYQFGRPTWLSEDGRRQAYILPGDLGIPANTPVLVQAFYANEDAKTAVPIDQIEVKPGLNPLPALMLPAGRFRVRVVDGADKVLREWQVTRDGATP